MKFMKGVCVIFSVFCEPLGDGLVSFPSIDLTFVIHLKIISKLKAGSLSKVKIVLANADTILVAINKQSNTNINEGN